MKHSNYIFTFTILVVTQILICNYLNLSHYVMLSLLPVSILCIPVKYNKLSALIWAFIAGLAVDFLAEGVIGLNALALLPVAFLKRPITLLVFGREVFARQEDISIRQHGLFKMSTAIIIAQSIFLLIYLWADDAWVRPFLFNLLRFFCSLGAGYAISIIIAYVISEEKTNQWE